MARPTKLTPALLKKAREYLDSYNMLGQVIPTVAGLSVYLKINRDTAYAWSGGEHDTPSHKRFSDIIGELMALQEAELINNGLNGAFNPTISKVILTKHGYVDKVDSNLNANVNLNHEQWLQQLD